MADGIYALEGNSALYEVLGVPRTATDKDIRKAYYKLAVLYHPDKNPDGAEVFKEICFAHNILSDPEQRAQYDNRTLKQNLQGRAKEYDPAMDPRVQLSPEDLRKFVEKVRTAHEASRADKDDFEKRRDEEMRRRAEYDANHPAFKADYERQRRLRQAQLAAGQRDCGAAATASSSSCGAVTSTTRSKTSAEMLAQLQEEENKRMYGEQAAKPSAAAPRAAGAMSVRQQMMSQFRTAQRADGSTTTSSTSLAASLRKSKESASHLPFVAEDNTPYYSEEVGRRVEQYANFDYLTFVERDMVDGGAIEGAILADSLDKYSVLK